MATSKALPKDVDFDLDVELEKDAAAPKKEPFKARLGERVLVFSDPDDLEWQKQLELRENPLRLLRYCLSDEDRTYLIGLRGVNSKAFAALIIAFREHYKLPNDGVEPF